MKSLILWNAILCTIVMSHASKGFSAETYGNFHTMGIVLDVPDGVTPHISNWGPSMFTTRMKDGG